MVTKPNAVVWNLFYDCYTTIILLKQKVVVVFVFFPVFEKLFNTEMYLIRRYFVQNSEHVLQLTELTIGTTMILSMQTGRPPFFVSTTIESKTTNYSFCRLEFGDTVRRSKCQSCNKIGIAKAANKLNLHDRSICFRKTRFKSIHPSHEKELFR